VRVLTAFGSGVRLLTSLKSYIAPGAAPGLSEAEAEAELLEDRHRARQGRDAGR
jgi:hypothetical protein